MSRRSRRAQPEALPTDAGAAEEEEDDAETAPAASERSPLTRSYAARTRRAGSARASERACSPPARVTSAVGAWRPRAASSGV